MSVPLHLSAEGLPIGVQFVAPFVPAGCCSACGQLEQAAP